MSINKIYTKVLLSDKITIPFNLVNSNIFYTLENMIKKKLKVFVYVRDLLNLNQLN